MGNKYIADLAKHNINILDIAFNPHNERYIWVTFEFQWRDARTHYTKWSKTAVQVTKAEYVDASMQDIAEAVLQATKEARAVLEGWEDGDR